MLLNICYSENYFSIYFITHIIYGSDLHKEIKIINEFFILKLYITMFKIMLY
jgi:hypothetical protein